MADDIRSDIIINVDTSVGIAEIKNLQRQISQLNAQLLKSGAQQAQSAQNIQRNLINNINATGQFAASVRTISTTAESFTSSLEKNKLSMGEYFRYAGASTKTFGRLFRSEFDTIEKVARERVKTLQTQYVKLGRDGSGAMKAIAVRPLALDMENLATKTAIAAQRQQLFNQLVKQGSTNLLNFGKNTQWAGRQLMVGFTIPLAIFGSMAVKEFEKIEKQAIRFKRVYGDAFDTEGATDQALDEMKRLADGFTKYGVEIEKTLELAADAAQMGLKGSALRAQVTEATRLAVLGEVDQQEALRATIAVTDAFGVASEKLASKIDFLNSVENETVTAINDLTIAIPKAGPVVKQLGGDVEDLAFFLTAMKEGGINASEGANALKSGLAALINPTGKASEMLSGLGINIKGIVEANKGDVKGVVIDFAQALDTLDPLNRARAIEQLFGKFQFARLSTLFQNVIKDGSQAQKVLKLANATSEELAIISERELKRVEESPLFKFQSQLEKFQAALAPVGSEFLKAITPIVQFGAELLKNFNNMSDGAKQFAVVATTLIGGIGPVFLMMFGLIANGAANIIKLFANLMGVFSKTGNSSRMLGISTDYMTQQQLEATAVASSLNQSHATLVQTFAVEAGAVDKLAASYARAIVQQSRFLGVNPETGAPVVRGAGRAPKKYARGVLSVPGPKGAGDVVPAMLSPGEAVIPAKQASKYRGLVSSMISDNIPGFKFGFNPFASMLKRSRVGVRMQADTFMEALRSSGKDGKYKSAFDTQAGADYLTKYGFPNPRQKQLRSDMERDLFGLDPRTTPSSARPTYGYANTSILQSLINKIFGIKGRNFNALTSNISEKSLARYGNIDVLTRSSVAKRSTAYPNDMLMEYARARESGRSIAGIRGSQIPAPMRGATPEQLKAFERLGLPFGSNLVAGTKSQYSINPRSPYVETQTPGGFSFKEIDKIIARDPAIAKQLKQELKAAGLSGVRVTGSGFAARLFKGLGVPGYKYGTEEIKQMRFDPSKTLESSHFSPSVGEGLTRKQISALFESELQKGIKSGAFKRRGIDPNQLKEEFFKTINKLPENNLRLYSNMVEALPALANQATANPDSTKMSGKDYLKSLRKMPKGLFGSGILTRLPEGHGIGDRQLKSYILNIEKSFTSELKKNYDLRLKESDIHKMYQNAEASAVRKIKNPVAKRLIQDANSLGRLGMTPAQGPGQKSGSTRRYLSLFGNVQDKTISLRRSGILAKMFGPTFTKKLESNFLSQTKIEIPQNLKNRIVPLLDSLPKKDAMRFSNELIKTLAMPPKARYETMEQLVDARESGRDYTVKEPKSTTAKKPATKKPRPAAPKSSKAQASLSKILSVGNKGARAVPVARGIAAILARLSQNRFNDGVVSVPGPKGAGDVVPAMLAPGEAVIPAKMSEKYAPLINSMIAGKVPGYENGLEAAGLKRGPKGGYYDAVTGAYVKPADAQKRISAANARNRPDPRERFARNANRVGMIGMGGSMAASAAMMLPGKAGEIAQGVAPALLGLSSLAMLIQGPVSAALVALVAAIGLPMYAAFKLNEAFNKAQESAYDLASALGSGDQALKKFAEFAGNATASEIMDRRRKDSLNQFPTATGRTTFGQAFVQSEQGKGAISNVVQAIQTGGRQGAASQLTNQMLTAVASGAMDAKQARSVVANIAEQMGDAAFGIQVNAQLLTMLGPNGEDLMKDPVGIRLKILDTQQEELNKSFQAALDSTKDIDWKGIGTAIGGAAAGAGLGAGIGAAIGTAILPGIGTAVGAVVGTVAGGISGGFTGYFAGSADYKKNIAAATGASVAMGVMAIEQQQQMSDSLELEYEHRIAAAEAAGDLVEKEKLLKELQEARVDLLERNQSLTASITANFETADADVQNALLSGARKAATKRFKDTQMADVLTLGQTKLDEAVTAGTMTKSQQYVIEMQVASGEIDPMQFLNIMNMPETTRNQTFNIIGKYGGAFANQVSALTSFFVDENGKPIESVTTNFIAKVDAAKTPEEANEIMEFYRKVTQASGKDAAFSVRFLMANPAAAKKLQDQYDILDSLKGDFSIKVLMDTKGLDPEVLQQINEDLDEFNKLTPEGKEVYTRVLTTLTHTVKTVHDPKVQLWLSGEGAKWKNYDDPTILREYRQATALEKAEAGFDTTLDPNAAENQPETPGGTAKEDPLKEPLQRLKEVRAAAVNAAGGVKELNRWLGGNKNMKQFQGLEQRLMKRGVNRTFIDYLLGLDKDVQDKFVKFQNGILKITAAGKNLAKMFNEIALGEYQISLKEASQEAENQSRAFNKLVAAGMSVAEALKAIEDPATAAAIASKSISSEELKQLAKDANDAAAKVGLVAARLQLVKDIQQAAGELAMKDRFARNNTNFNELEQAAIEFDSTLSETYQKFLTGMIRVLPAEFRTRMQQVVDSIEFKESIFENGFSKAMEAFAAQEENLQISMELKLKDFSITGVAQKGAREILNQAQEEISALQFRMDDLRAGIQEIEWQEDAVNEKYDKRLDALDKIEKANEAISAQQKTQISLADALTQGDIAAAARAAQEMRAQSAQGAIGNQRDILEAARQGALGALRSSGGKTRSELESDILKIEKEIFKIEEQRLEPAAEAVRLAEARLANDTESLVVLGKTKLEWTQIKNGIDLAVTSSEAYKNAMQAALDIVKSIVAYWNSISGTAPTLRVRNESDQYGIMSTPGIATANETNKNYFQNSVLPAIAAGTASGSQIRDYVTAVNQSLGRPRNTPVAMAKGGMVPYMANGGIFESRGTDTVPAMLTPGEFVVRKYAVEKYGVDKMRAINNGTHSSDSVYNYEVNVNVKTDANADQIARSVIGQIKQIDSQRIRGNRF